jgi:hypothetical protein
MVTQQLINFFIVVRILVELSLADSSDGGSFHRGSQDRRKLHEVRDHDFPLFLAQARSLPSRFYFLATLQAAVAATIQAAIDSSVDGDTILVADGPTKRTLT